MNTIVNGNGNQAKSVIVAVHDGGKSIGKPKDKLNSMNVARGDFKPSGCGQGMTGPNTTSTLDPFREAYGGTVKNTIEQVAAGHVKQEDLPDFLSLEYVAEWLNSENENIKWAEKNGILIPPELKNAVTLWSHNYAKAISTEFQAYHFEDRGRKYHSQDGEKPAIEIAHGQAL
ncbi:MAG: hypothetical protein P8176_06050, partial [Gammaproteobacteria bacterium]